MRPASARRVGQRSSGRAGPSPSSVWNRAPQLAETERRILEQHPTLAPVSGPAMLAAALRTSSVIGRAHEQRRELVAAWQAAKSGTGQVRLCDGAVGERPDRDSPPTSPGGRSPTERLVDYVRGDELLHALAAYAGWGAPRHRARSWMQIAERCRSSPLLLIVDDAEWATGPAVDAHPRRWPVAVDQLALLVVLVIDPSAGGPAVTALGRLDPTGAATIRSDRCRATSWPA